MASFVPLKARGEDGAHTLVSFLEPRIPKHKSLVISVFEQWPLLHPQSKRVEVACILVCEGFCIQEYRSKEVRSSVVMLCMPIIKGVQSSALNVIKL